MALEAVAHSRRMDLTLYVGGILVRVASKTQRIRRGRDQLDMSYIFGGANLVAARAAHGNR